MRTLIRTHWEGTLMALFMAAAFALAGMLDEPAENFTVQDGHPTAYAAKE